MAYTPPPQFATPEFLTRLQRQDREAVQQVVHEFLPQILRAARGAGLDEHEADDVTQQTFLTFIETLPRFEGRSQVRTWLFGIFYHKLREARRGFQKQERHDDIDDVLESRFDDRGMWQTPPREADDDLWDQQIRRRLEPGPLDRTASGGELSRVVLALRLAGGVADGAPAAKVKLPATG